jgi:hypothetical protein
VVSWKDAADRKESVASEAFVMPIRKLRGCGLAKLCLSVGLFFPILSFASSSS